MLKEIKSRLSKAKKHTAFIISIAMPIFLLYLIDPSSFQNAWKGRLFYGFFLWIFSIELVLNWRRINKNKLKSRGKIRLLGIFLSMLVPILYIGATRFGLIDVIVQLGRVVGVPSGGRYGQELAS